MWKEGGCEDSTNGDHLLHCLLKGGDRRKEQGKTKGGAKSRVVPLKGKEPETLKKYSNGLSSFLGGLGKFTMYGGKIQRVLEFNGGGGTKGK